LALFYFFRAPPTTCRQHCNHGTIIIISLRRSRRLSYCLHLIIAIMTTTSSTKKPSESDVYDRQIRLWGAEAQAKMQQSRVLYIHITGVSSEVLKNLVLAGIAATICDTRSLDQVAGMPSIFLPPSTCIAAQDDNNNDNNGDSSNKKTKYASVAQAVQLPVQELNPLLGDCPLLEKSVSELTEEDLKGFSIVVASHISKADAIRISTITTKAGGKFYLADSFGLMGACVFDLGPDAKFRPEQGKQIMDEQPLAAYVSFDKLMAVPLKDAINRFHKTPPPIWAKYRSLLEYVDSTGGKWPTEETAGDFAKAIASWLGDDYSLLKDHSALSESALEELAKVATAEVAPVCAVLGGMIGNEVIKAISGKGEPANNTFLFDGAACKAWTFLVQPKP
jgi:ubiquitin-like 1-activating enzyme E1 A